MKYHFSSILVAKCGITIARANRGFNGAEMYKLKHYLFELFPNIKIYLPLFESYTRKFFIDPSLTLPPKFNINAPIF